MPIFSSVTRIVVYSGARRRTPRTGYLGKNMTLDELFDNTFAGTAKPLAVLSISSGSSQGVYRMPLQIVTQPPVKPGGQHPRPKQELQAFSALQITQHENQTLVLTIERGLGPVILGPPKGSFSVSIDVSVSILGHPPGKTNITSFAPPADGPAVRPCQSAEAYFQSPDQLVHCCIFHNG